MESARVFIHKHQLIIPGEKVLIAVSGGRDSMALLHFLYQSEYDIAVAHVNYNLRGDDSIKDQDLVEQTCSKLGVPCYVMSTSKPTKVNTQLWARDVRYGFFEELIATHNFQRVATAHHEADAIETMLLNMMRGSGIKGLAGIPRKRNEYIRPLLSTTNKEVDDYVDQHKIEYRNDASNDSTEYLRNAIRKEVIPLMQQHDENLRAKLRATLSNTSDDSSAISDMINMHLGADGESRSIDLADFPDQSMSTWLYHFLDDYGFNRTQSDNLASADSGARVQSKSFIATKKGSTVHVLPIEFTSHSTEISTEGLYVSGSEKLTIARHSFIKKHLPMTPNHVWMDAKRVSFPLQWKSIEDSMRFQPLGASYSVSVLSYLKDFGIDAVSRKRHSVLLDNTQQIIWIPRVQLADGVKCTEQTTHVISAQVGSMEKDENQTDQIIGNPKT